MKNISSGIDWFKSLSLRWIFICIKLLSHEKRLLLSLIAIVLFACNDHHGNNAPERDPDYQVSFRPAPGISTSDTGHLSLLRIVKESTGIRYKLSDGTLSGIGITECQRDTVNMKLFMLAARFIYKGELCPDVIECTDLVFTSFDRVNQKNRDTLAYTPNAVLRKAAMEIKRAHYAGDIDAVYRAYDSAYTYIPITGKEWRELKAQGKI